MAEAGKRPTSRAANEQTAAFAARREELRQQEPQACLDAELPWVGKPMPDLLHRRVTAHNALVSGVALLHATLLRGAGAGPSGAAGLPDEAAKWLALVVPRSSGRDAYALGAQNGDAVIRRVVTPAGAAATAALAALTAAERVRQGAADAADFVLQAQLG